MPGGWEWLIIIGVLVLLFGAKRLPEMARSMGQSARVFKGEMKGLRDDDRGAPQQQQPRAAELPPADGQQYPAPPYPAGNAQPTEPVRRDADH